ncbi:S9 family peptidase [Nonomuraea sp. SMC257]|uniref:S9 family peptidase n=1 Tax=Nonomuraea montanisoli TaxID=2741721 RepID=A0A7Y6IDR6_9ACTN|nr:prolyl oligopeptidase family serine peptidase [Nonomuraea montanisoli]NUW36281.1 S9 family peptidase [Nonomuraea montanisoli]
MARLSPLPADLVGRATVTFDALQSAGGTIYWIEGRPEGDVLRAWSSDEGRSDVLPQGFQVASYVHEYGGGAYVVGEPDVWFCNASDQRIYRYRPGSPPYPVTPVPERPGAHRYADLRRVPGDGRLVCVRERHEGSAVHNELVMLPGDGSAEPEVIAAGDDFYMSPALSPDGKQLAWVSWNAPLMPWDGSRLWLADLEGGERRLIAGGDDESVCQPQWDAKGILHFVSDRSGWWNLYARDSGRTIPVLTGKFELAAAPWEFGYRTYALSDDRIITIAQRGSEHLLLTRTGNGDIHHVELPYTSMKPYLATVGADVVVIASSPTRLPEVVKVTPGGAAQELASTGLTINGYAIAHPQRFSFTTRDGTEAHGLFYLPTTKVAEPPPLIVRVHPGPTANWPMRLDLHAQYLTGRGFAVADVDHRGSTGYGRVYRNGLRHRWGEADVADCVDAALYLISAGRADGHRVVIWGASAGGFTVLSALSSTNVFAGGIARSAVVDPEEWGRSAPKFQAHHPTLLTSRSPEPAFLSPLLLIHGDADPVTPLEAVRALAQQSARSRLVVIPGAGHTFRRPGDVTTILKAELEHLRAVLEADA